jgi:hypothetical protein
MPAESWIAPDDVPALAAEATALIDTALSRLPEDDRVAFWASVRKCYNTPYNDPKPRALPRLPMSAASEAAGPAPAEAPALSTLAAPALASVMAVFSGAETHAA